MIATMPTEEPGTRRGEPSAPEKSVLRKMGTVLLAEDDAAMRNLLAGQLVRRGYEVVLAEDGLHLATQLDRWLNYPGAAPLVAIVSDVRMPGASGLRVLRWLRRRVGYLPVVLITAFGSAELHDEGRRLGATVLDKPFAVRELLNVLDGLIDMGSDAPQ